MPQKPLTDNDATMFLGVRLPSRMVARLKDEARQGGATLSAHVRRLLDGKDDALNTSGSAKKLAALERQHKEVLAERERLRKALDQRAVFSAKDYAALLMVVHPDNSASEKVRNRIAHLVTENRERLCKPPEPPPKPTDVSRMTATEMQARRAAAQAARSAKAKAAAEKRKATKQQ